MIKQLTTKLRVKTEPLNWIIQVLRKGKWKDEAYLSHLDGVKRYVSKHFCVPEKDLIKLDDFKRELGLKKSEDASAWYLTNIKKYPEFLTKVHPNSLKNLKSK